jgi:uncharacterized OB-fold protein
VDIPFKQGIMHLGTSEPNDSYLIGSKCQSCSSVAFPKRVVCHKCLSENVTEIPLSKRGNLASFTVAWAAPEGIQPPVILGYVDLPEGVRIFSMLTGCKPERDALQTGQEMELTFEEIRQDGEGNQIIAFMFRPVMKGES